MKYIEVEFFLDSLDMYSEILQSDLCDIGFESFQDTSQGFLAYCPEELFSKDEINSLIVRFIENNPDVSISTKIKEIEQQNWNQEWEKTNSPVLVDEYCYIYPYFYEPLKDIEYNYNNKIIDVKKMIDNKNNRLKLFNININCDQSVFISRTENKIILIIL